jgi:hypothetical protein
MVLEKNKNILLLPGFKPLTIQSVVAIPTVVSWLQRRTEYEEIMY